MSWLRRLVSSISTWKRLHIEEARKDIFNPVNSNMESSEANKRRMTNPVWKDIYSALLKCRNHIVDIHPEECTSFPINGKPDLTINHCGVQQICSAGLKLYQILTDRGYIKDLNDIIVTVRPLKMEYDVMAKAIWKKIDYLRYFAKTLSLSYCLEPSPE